MRIHKIFIFTGLGVFIFFMATLRGYQGNLDTPQTYQPIYHGDYASAFESPHERATYLLMLSILEHQRIRLDPVNALWGGVDMGIYKGNVYSLFPPGVALSIIPLFLIGKMIGLAQVFSYSTIAIIATLNVLFLYLISKHIFKLTTTTSICTGLLFAFATPAWSYAGTIFQHHTTTLLMLSSFYASYLYSSTEKYRWLIASLLLFAVSWLFDYTNMIILFPIIIFLIKRKKKVARKDLIIIGMTLIITISSIFMYNSLVFGKWYITSNNLPLYTQDHSIASTHQTQREPIFNEFNPLHMPQGLYALLLAPYRGLLFFSPIFLFSLWGIRLWYKNRTPISITFLALSISTIVLYSLYKYPDGGWTYGPRYIIPAMATLSPYIGIWLEKGSMRFKGIISWILISFGSGIALLGALTTNMVPYILQAYQNNGDYTFKRMYTYLLSDKSPSFVYNTVFSHFSLISYYIVILYCLMLTFGFLLYIITSRQEHR